MKRFLKEIYLKAPFSIKKLFANLEAIRRNFYRRNGNYKSYYESIDVHNMLNEFREDLLIEKINKLLMYSKEHISYYRSLISMDAIESLDEISRLPLIDKNQMTKDISKFINEKAIKKLWKGKTSGSTGTPFSYYRDRESMRYEYALYDKFYDHVSRSNNYNKARISGVNITKPDIIKPPFWYFISVFNQLQLSAYHINNNTYEYYIDALIKYNIKLGTGYAKAWLFLAQYMLENNESLKQMEGIITDSEGITEEEKLVIERAFNCTVYQTYGLSEVGILAVQCKFNHYHILNDRCFVEIIDENGNCVENGKLGEIVVTDLKSFDAPFIRYRTGDLGILRRNNCDCGWEAPYIEELCGRVDDYIIASDGRKISRLSHIAKPAKGIAGMQLIQEEIGELDIYVVPFEDFDVDSMDDVLKAAYEYIGDIRITWKVVDVLEKNKAGKVKYVIRKFDNY